MIFRALSAYSVVLYSKQLKDFKERTIVGQYPLQILVINYVKTITCTKETWLSRVYIITKPLKITLFFSSYEHILSNTIEKL